MVQVCPAVQYLLFAGLRIIFIQCGFSPKCIVSCKDVSPDIKRAKAGFQLCRRENWEKIFLVHHLFLLTLSVPIT